MKNLMKPNMGLWDRTVRICISVCLLILGIFIVSGGWGIVLLVIGVVMLSTSLLGFCPAYVPFGICTRHDRPSQS